MDEFYPLSGVNMKSGGENFSPVFHVAKEGFFCYNTSIGQEKPIRRISSSVE